MLIIVTGAIERGFRFILHKNNNQHSWQYTT